MRGLAATEFVAEVARNGAGSAEGGGGFGVNFSVW